MLHGRNGKTSTDLTGITPSGSDQSDRCNEHHCAARRKNRITVEKASVDHIAALVFMSNSQVIRDAPILHTILYLAPEE